jgi:hypothetical protein
LTFAFGGERQSLGHIFARAEKRAAFDERSLHLRCHSLFLLVCL